ncbi:MAG TPA: hypothetical protein DF712_03875, partial [Balneola sp.]|nr:hypothetical protein [Balneola sp.]
VIKEQLETGDYQLQEDPMGTVIERKGSLSELSKNCITKDNKRFLSALDRLAEARNPILMAEGTPTNFLRPQRYVEKPEIVLDCLLKFLQERKIQLLLMPTGARCHRQAFSDWCARLLINGYRWTK